MNNIMKVVAGVAVVGSASFVGAVPVVSNVTMTQDGSAGRQVTITYELSEDAVVTLDVMTNATANAATGWTSIGGQAICNAQGAVWRKVTSADANNGVYTITWRPDLSWTDENGNGFKIADGCAKAVVTAWTLNNTPDYMVVDVSATAQQNTQSYYPSVDFVPGGVLANTIYRNSMLLMRKIMAKDVTWTMGSVLEGQRASNETTHQVTLTNNYYIGVFPVTQEQWALVKSDFPNPPSQFTADRAMRPVVDVSYNLIRNNNVYTENPAYNWPNAPKSDSFLGHLRTKTGIDFDLPSEAQWEFAARAGNGDTKWGNGLDILNADADANLDLYGRYKLNGGYIDGTTEPALSCSAENGTAIVGSYAPNAWGLYDMAGNVFEWCLDWYENDITAYNGRVNIDPSNPAKTLSGADPDSGKRVARGGYWSQPASFSRPAYRGSIMSNLHDYHVMGLRVVCTAGLD